jgi:NADH-quinone oxidoreductase subunit M
VNIEEYGGTELRAKVDQVYPAEMREEDRQDARTALNGAVLQMFNHGLSSAGMFLLVGALYHKAHTRDLRRFGGLWALVPVFGALLIFTSMASLGLPGLNGFTGEFLIVAGSFKAYPVYVLLSLFGLLVTGIYILKAIQMVLHGPPNAEWAEYDRSAHRLEIDKREVLALAPLVALMLITGLYPNWVLDVINSGVVNWFTFPGV